MGAIHLFLVVKIMIADVITAGWGGDYIDLEEHWNAELLSTTLIERNSEGSQRCLRTSREPGERSIERLCSTNSTAAVPRRFMSLGFGNRFSSKAGILIS